MAQRSKAKITGIEIEQKAAKPKKDKLHIHTDDGHRVTEKYMTLTRNFYLNF